MISDNERVGHEEDLGEPSHALEFFGESSDGLLRFRAAMVS